MVKVYWDFFLQFYKNPTLSFNNFANILQKSPITTKSHHAKLIELNVIETDKLIEDKRLGPRISTAIKAIVDPTKLKLQWVLLRLKVIENTQKLEFLQNLLSSVPFISRIDSGITKKHELLVYFTIPKDELQHLSSIGNQFLSFNLIKDYQVMPVDYLIRGFHQFTHWDVDNRSWKFQEISGDASDYAYADLLTKLLNFKGSKSRSKPLQIELKQKKLDLTDFKLLRELEINSRVSLKQLTEFYSLDPSSLSRRIKSLRDNLIESYSVAISKEYFRLTKSCFVGKLSDIGLQIMKMVMVAEELKFETEFRFGRDNYFSLQVSAPHQILEEIHRFLLEITVDLERVIGIRHSQLESFNPNHFQFKLQQWHSSFEKILQANTIILESSYHKQSIFDSENKINRNVTVVALPVIKSIEKILSKVQVTLGENKFKLKKAGNLSISFDKILRQDLSEMSQQSLLILEKLFIHLEFNHNDDGSGLDTLRGHLIYLVKEILSTRTEIQGSG